MRAGFRGSGGNIFMWAKSPERERSPLAARRKAERELTHNNLSSGEVLRTGTVRAPNLFLGTTAHLH